MKEKSELKHLYNEKEVVKKDGSAELKKHAPWW